MYEMVPAAPVGMRPFSFLVVVLFMSTGFGGILPGAEAQLPLDDVTRLSLCTGQPDSCLVEQFFSDPSAPRHTWSHTSFLLPRDFSLPSIGDDNSFLLSLENGRVVGLLEAGDQIHALHGGDLSAAALTGNDWFHIAMTYQPGTWKLYPDGVEVAERTNLNSTLSVSAKGALGADSDQNRP